MAAPAFRRTSSARSAGSVLKATPRLAVTRTVSPATENGARSALARRHASWVASVSDSTSLARTTNSSPPNRATESSGRTARWRRRATATSSSSPEAVLALAALARAGGELRDLLRARGVGRVEVVVERAAGERAGGVVANVLERRVGLEDPLVEVERHDADRRRLEDRAVAPL